MDKNDLNIPKILVIDDEEMIRSIASRILTRAGYEVIIAEDGKSGIDKFQSESENIDLILCDVNMDDISGIEVLQTARKIQPDIPGIISSGNEYSTDNLPSDLQNQIYFLQKPYRASQLKELIQSIIVPQS